MEGTIGDGSNVVYRCRSLPFVLMLTACAAQASSHATSQSPAATEQPGASEPSAATKTSTASSPSSSVASSTAPTVGPSVSPALPPVPPDVDGDTAGEHAGVGLRPCASNPYELCTTKRPGSERVEAPRPCEATPYELCPAGSTFKGEGCARDDPSTCPAGTAFVDGEGCVTKRRDAGTLELNAKPWAQVFLDGQRMGTTPMRVPATPGRHRIVFRLPCVGERVVDVDVKRGERTRALVTME